MFKSRMLARTERPKLITYSLLNPAQHADSSGSSWNSLFIPRQYGLSQSETQNSVVDQSSRPQSCKYPHLILQPSLCQDTPHPYATAQGNGTQNTARRHTLDASSRMRCSPASSGGIQRWVNAHQLLLYQVQSPAHVGRGIPQRPAAIVIFLRGARNKISRHPAVAVAGIVVECFSIKRHHVPASVTTPERTHNSTRPA